MVSPIQATEAEKYQSIFNDLGPTFGKLSGEKVKQVSSFSTSLNYRFK